MSKKQRMPITVTSSVIIPTTEDPNKFIYVKTSKDGKWGLPAGKVDLLEHPMYAAVREAREETGLTTVATGLVGIWPFKSLSGNSIVNFVYAARIIEGTPRPLDGVDDLAAYSLTDLRRIYAEGNLRGRFNLDPVEIFLRKNRRTYPVEIVHPVMSD